MVNNNDIVAQASVMEEVKDGLLLVYTCVKITIKDGINRKFLRYGRDVPTN